MPDVDIDFFDRDKALKLFKHTPASMIKDDNIEKHKTGVYFHAIPTNWSVDGFDASTSGVVMESVTLSYQNFIMI